MDDNAPQENPTKDFNKIDLTQLQGFSFGTQWSQEKNAREPGRTDRPRREDGGDRRDDRGAPDRRDRRAFRRPAGEAPTTAPTGPSTAPVGEGARPPRRDDGGGAGGGGGADNRGPRREFRGEFRGGPRRDGPGGGDRSFNRGAPQDRGPYDSPYFTSTFYPEDVSFTALAKTIRASCRTFELFDIAKTVVGKADRFVVVLQRKAPGAGPGQGGENAPANSPARQPLFVSVPDSIPFETEEAAIAHVMANHLGLFFDTAEVEIDPPKGNFQVVNRDGVTGELLAPPNYHRYNQIVQQHFATKVSRMSFEAFKSRIETVRDPEVIAQWIEKMKKTTRYTWKYGRPAEPAAKPAVAEVAPPPTTATETTAVPAAEAEVAPAAPAPASEAPAAVALPPASFDNIEEARTYLLNQARDKVVRSFENVRFHGKILETIPQGEIRRAVEGTLERQRRFPLDTANALRGRLRREGFTIFKKGSKGISYVCAVKRKFRVPNQVFSDSIGALIAFIEANPMVKASELPNKFLGLAPTPAKPAVDAAAPTEGANPAPEAAAPVISFEDRAKVSRLQGDLTWLVHEGYVTEFIDGRLFAPPVMVEARKKEVESEEHDPENFPEAPPSDTTPPMAATSASAPAEEPSSAPAETPTASEEPPAPAQA
jgi:hypothetical protein